jgi:hypothetical protein
VLEGVAQEAGCNHATELQLCDTLILDVMGGSYHVSRKFLGFDRAMAMRFHIHAWRPQLSPAPQPRCIS